jgi:hypothetical protein
MECSSVRTLIFQREIVEYTTCQDEYDSIRTSKVSIETENKREEEYEWVEDMMLEYFASYLETSLCIVDNKCKYECQIRHIGAKQCCESIIWDSLECRIYSHECLRKDRDHSNNEESDDKFRKVEIASKISCISRRHSCPTKYSIGSRYEYEYLFKHRE